MFRVDVDVNIPSMCCITGIFICICMQEGVNVRLASGQCCITGIFICICVALQVFLVLYYRYF